jgi:hypothetical protein
LRRIKHKLGRAAVGDCRAFFFFGFSESVQTEMAEPAPKRAKGDMNAQVKAAVREAERAEWIGNECEIEFLKKQSEEITRIQPLGKEDELLAIIQQLEQKAARDRQKAAASANKTEVFTCSICMDKRPLNHLRVNLPCGHGFCKACIDAAWHAHGAPAAPECFTCRIMVVDVVKTLV